MTRDPAALRLPPDPNQPERPPWPGWNGVRGIRPGPALAALIAETSRPGWPGWAGTRPGPDHTHHDKHPNRERGE